MTYKMPIVPRPRHTVLCPANRLTRANQLLLQALGYILREDEKTKKVASRQHHRHRR